MAMNAILMNSMISSQEEFRITLTESLNLFAQRGKEPITQGGKRFDDGYKSQD